MNGNRIFLVGIRSIAARLFVGTTVLAMSLPIVADDAKVRAAAEAPAAAAPAPAMVPAAAATPATTATTTPPVAKAAPLVSGIGLLRLNNGDTVPGDFQPSEAADTLRWQGAAFTRPFEFEAATVSSVQFPDARLTHTVRPEFSVEFVNGDLLTGHFAANPGQPLEFVSAQVGPVPLQLDFVRRIDRIDNNPQVLLTGLSGLHNWNVTRSSWREDGVHLTTDQDLAAITGDFGVPDRAAIEFEISWTKRPNFTFAVGVNPKGTGDLRIEGWRFESWGEVLTLVREQKAAADVTRLLSIDKETKRIHLIAYLDQSTGTLHVCHPDGTLIGTATVPEEAPEPRDKSPKSGVRLVNRHGDIRLERLRISHWDGVLPRSEERRQSQVTLADGRTFNGDNPTVSTEAIGFELDVDDQRQVVLLKDLLSVTVHSTIEPPPSPVLVTFPDGTCLSGEVVKIDDEQLSLQSPLHDHVLGISRKSFRSMTRISPVAPSAGEDTRRKGKLELDGHQLTGWLSDAEESESASCLTWLPLSSRTSSPLIPTAAGRIVYRESPPATPAPVTNTRVPGQAGGANFGNLFLRKTREPIAPRTVTPVTHTLYLRSGDAISCTVVSIDDDGVTITSPVAEGQTVPHDKIKAIVLVPDVAAPKLETAKKERLLTIPRPQQDSPPTHLLYSPNGDFLRCRLLSLDDNHLRIELQLNEIEIPRKRVAQVIWFHADELPTTEADTPNTGSAAAAATASKPSRSSGLVQVLQRDGNRVTFDPSAVSDSTVIGTSDVLGACRFHVKDIDQLIFGGQIDVAVSQLAYHQWKLQPATLPLIAMDLEDGSPDQGSVSPLVGKDAPEIDLELLAGGRFKLSACKGQIVVLDFWATWCGPCMQTMPLVEAAMRDFNPEQVRLVSVNLEESADHVKAVMERQKLDVAVALDIDGVAARRFEANAIPQLVIIDRDGKVARLYVGGGSTVVNQLKASITELLNTEPATTTPAGG